MHVQIDDRNVPYLTGSLEETDRYRDIVEDAEPFAPIAECMVGSPRQVDAGATIEGVVGRFEGTLNGVQGPLAQLGGPGEAEAARGNRVQGSVEDRGYICRLMDHLQRFNRDPFGLLDVMRRQSAGRDNCVADQCVFRNREAVT
jgi:hypothetical protein